MRGERKGVKGCVIRDEWWVDCASAPKGRGGVRSMGCKKRLSDEGREEGC